MTAYDSGEGMYRVRWEHNSETTMLPRLALCFDVEDPTVFGKCSPTAFRNDRVTHPLT